MFIFVLYFIILYTTYRFVFYFRMPKKINHVAQLMAPVPIEEDEVHTALGNAKTYWVRRHLLLEKPPLG